MNIFQKKGFQIALLGGIFGSLLSSLVQFYPYGNFFDSFFKGIAFIPVWAAIFLSGILWYPFCPLLNSHPELCSGQWLDSGYSDRVVNICAYSTFVLFYGFIFWVIYRIVKFFKERKKKL